MGPYGTYVEDSIEYRNVSSGFYVTPRINGELVTLEIAPRLERLTPEYGGAIDTQYASAIVNGRLGEWIALGGIAEDFDQASDVTLTRTRRRGSELRSIWVKVDEVK